VWPEIRISEQVCFFTHGKLKNKQSLHYNVFSGSGGYGYLMEWLWWTGLLTS